ncbi:HNH endonuclease [Stenotrophomonas bentonitica]|uniref:HNH endonuclease n=1 Tax=Stenotrophomonas bentonitica TaxID=1450134 RepID=UPI00345E3C64
MRGGGCPRGGAHRYLGEETNIVSNGLLLRADVHTLFDLKLVGVDTSTMQICVAPMLAASCYWELSGRGLATPSSERYAVDLVQLDKHRRQCLW